MTTTTYREIDAKLDAIIGQLNKLEQCQAIEHERVKALMDLVEKHERVLFGSNGDGGLIQDVNDLLKMMANMVKALWIVLTPILAAIGGGIIWLITHGPE